MSVQVVFSLNSTNMHFNMGLYLSLICETRHIRLIFKSAHRHIKCLKTVPLNIILKGYSYLFYLRCYRIDITKFQPDAFFKPRPYRHINQSEHVKGRERFLIGCYLKIFSFSISAVYRDSHRCDYPFMRKTH